MKLKLITKPIISIPISSTLKNMAFNLYGQPTGNFYGQMIGNPYGNYAYVQTPQVHVIQAPIITPQYYNPYGMTYQQNQAALPRNNSTTTFRRDAHGNVWYQDR